jgi:hypothetical protein
MTDPTFKAAIRPSLHPAAAELVAIYEAVPGALTYPGCCPEALAAVIDHIWAKPGQELDEVLFDLAALLRGEQP